MIISDEQVRLALRDLQRTSSGGGSGASSTSSAEVSSDLIRRVSESLAVLPETRIERVRQAREDLAGGRPSAEAVAGKILGRVISDSLR